MSLEISYCPQYIDYQTAKKYLPYIQDVINGVKGGLHIEKLHGANVFSLRINKADRLLFRWEKINGKRCIIMIEYLEKHQYNRSRFLRNHAKKFEVMPWSDDDAEHFQTSATSEDTSALQQVHFFGQKPIMLTTEQQAALCLKLPAIISGSPGSGKSVAAAAIMQQHSDSKILYVGPSRLAKSMKQQCTIDPDADGEICFTNYEDLLCSNAHPYLTESEFTKWLRNKCSELAKNQKTCGEKTSYFEALQKIPLQIHFEFGLVAALGEVKYKALGSKQSSLDEAKRADLIQIYEAYRKYLEAEDRSDLQFLPIAHDHKNKNYDLIVVDEAQNLSAAQIIKLLELTPNIVMCFDKRQCILTATGTQNVIQQYLKEAYQQNVSRTVLSQSWRCTKPVAELANTILELSNKLCPKQQRDYTHVTSALDSKEGLCALFNTVNTKNKKVLEELCKSLNTVIISNHTPESLPDCLRSGQILQPGEAIGLSFKTVIMYDLLTSEEIKTINNLLSTEKRREKDFILPLPLQTRLNEIFVGMTRAEVQLVMIQKEHHENKHIFFPVASKCLSNPDTSLIIKEKASTPAEWEARCKYYLQINMPDNARRILCEHLQYNAEAADARIKVFADEQAKKALPREKHQTRTALKKSHYKPLDEISLLNLYQKNLQSIMHALLNKNAGNTRLAEWLASPESAKRLTEAVKESPALRKFFITQMLQPCLYYKDKGQNKNLSILQTLLYYPHTHPLLFAVLPGFEKNKRKCNAGFLNKLNHQLLQVVTPQNKREILWFRLFEAAKKHDALLTFDCLFEKLPLQAQGEALSFINNPSDNRGDTLAFGLCDKLTLDPALIRQLAWIRPTDDKQGTAPLLFYLLRSYYFQETMNKDEFTNICRNLLFNVPEKTNGKTQWNAEAKKQLFKPLLDNPKLLIEPLRDKEGNSTTLFSAFASNEYSCCLLIDIFQRLEFKLTELAHTETSLFIDALQGNAATPVMERPFWKMVRIQQNCMMLKYVMERCPEILKKLRPFILENVEVFRENMRKSMQMDDVLSSMLDSFCETKDSCAPEKKWFKCLKSQFFPITRNINTQSYPFFANAINTVEKKLLDTKLGDLDRDTLKTLCKKQIQQLNNVHSAFTRLCFADGMITKKELLMIYAFVLAQRGCKSTRQTQSIEILKMSYKDLGVEDYFIVIGRDRSKATENALSYTDSIFLDTQKQEFYPMDTSPEFHPLDSILRSEVIGMNCYTSIAWSYAPLLQLIKYNYDPKLNDTQNQVLQSIITEFETILAHCMPCEWLDYLLEPPECTDSIPEICTQIFNSKHLSIDQQAALKGMIERTDVSRLKTLLLEKDSKTEDKGSLITHLISYRLLANIRFDQSIFANPKLEFLFLKWLQKHVNLPGGESQPLISIMVQKPAGIQFLRHVINKYKNNPFLMQILASRFLQKWSDKNLQTHMPLFTWLCSKGSDGNSLPTLAFLQHAQTEDLRNAIMYIDNTQAGKQENFEGIPLLLMLCKHSPVLQKFFANILDKNQDNIHDWKFIWCSPNIDGQTFESLLQKKISDDMQWFVVHENNLENIFEPAFKKPELLLRKFREGSDQKYATVLHVIMRNQRDYGDLLRLIMDNTPNLIDAMNADNLFISKNDLGSADGLHNSTFWCMLATDNGHQLIHQLLKKKPEIFKCIRKVLDEKNMPSDPRSRENYNRIIRHAESIHQLRHIMRRLGVLPPVLHTPIDQESLKKWFKAVPCDFKNTLPADTSPFLRVYEYKINPLMKNLGIEIAKENEDVRQAKAEYVNMMAQISASIITLCKQNVSTADRAILLAFAIQQELYNADPVDARVAVLFTQTQNTIKYYIVLNYNDMLMLPSRKEFFESPGCQIIDIQTEEIIDGLEFYEQLFENLCLFWASNRGLDHMFWTYKELKLKDYNERDQADAMQKCLEAIAAPYREIAKNWRKMQVGKKIPALKADRPATPIQYSLFATANANNSSKIAGLDKQPLP